jgi:hypothetical protein
MWAYANEYMAKNLPLYSRIRSHCYALEFAMMGSLLCAENLVTNGECTSRRSFLCGIVAASLTAIIPARVAASERWITVRGPLCSLWFSAPELHLKVSTSTGADILDQQLSLEANRLAGLFQFRPGLMIVEEPFSMADNAQALRENMVRGTRGTVLFGRTRLFEELQQNRRSWGGLVIAGILAHEFAHIYQFFTPYEKRLKERWPTKKPMELHADFLAGYHLGLKRRQGAAMDIGAFMDTAYIIGDDKVTSTEHHGNPDERRHAVREGYRTGIKGPETISMAAEVGYETVQEVMKHSG